jgi:hypothetical protein
MSATQLLGGKTYNLCDKPMPEFPSECKVTMPSDLFDNVNDPCRKKITEMLKEKILPEVFSLDVLAGLDPNDTVNQDCAHSCGIGQCTNQIKRT